MNRKYFLIANYIERPIRTQKAVKSHDTDVFEDFESLLEITATNASNAKIQWEMAEKDAFSFTNTANIKEAAKEILDKIQIIGLKNEKFLYALNEACFKRFSSVFSKDKDEYENVVFLQEKALKILQNKIKSRKFLMNYKRFRKEILKKNVIIKGIFKIASEKCLIFLFENKPELEISIFELKLFTNSKIVVKYESYQSLLEICDKRIRTGVLGIIENFISLDKMQNLHYDEKECLENLRRFERNI